MLFILRHSLFRQKQILYKNSPCRLHQSWAGMAGASVLNTNAEAREGETAFWSAIRRQQVCSVIVTYDSSLSFQQLVYLRAPTGFRQRCSLTDMLLFRTLNAHTWISCVRGSRNCWIDTVSHSNTDCNPPCVPRNGSYKLRYISKIFSITESSHIITLQSQMNF